MTITTEVNFTIESNFAKSYAESWENLLLYKNGLLEDMCSNDSILSNINSPNQNYLMKTIDTNKTHKSSFTEELKSLIDKTKVYDFKTIGLVNTIQEEKSFTFDFKIKAQVDFLFSSKRISNNTLVYKVHPDNKINVELEDIESLINTTRFSYIDFSKPSTELEIFKSAIESEISDSWNDDVIYSREKNNNKSSSTLVLYNNTEFKKTYDKMLKSLSGNKINFSSTLGFSVKTLSVSDISNFLKLTLSQNTSMTELKNFLSEKDGYGKLFFTGKADSYGYLDSKIRKFVEDSLFTISYFSCFGNEGEETYLKVNNVKNLNMTIAQSKKNANKTSITKNGENNLENLEVSLFKDEDFSELIKKDLKNAILVPKKSITIKNLLKSNLSFIKYIKHNSANEIEIKLEYTLIESLSVLDNDFFEDNKDYFYFHPQICLETVNGSEILLDIDKSSESVDITLGYFIEKYPDAFKFLSDENKRNISDNVVAKKHIRFYTISLENILKSTRLRSKNIRSLKKMYGNKFYIYKPEVVSKNNDAYILNNLSSIDKTQKTVYMSIRSNKFNSFDLEVEKEISKENPDFNSQDSQSEKDSKPKPKPKAKKPPRKRNDKSLKATPEGVLKVIDYIPVGDTRDNKDENLDKNNAESKDDKEKIKDINEHKEAVNNKELILNWFRLNGIDKNNPNGVRKTSEEDFINSGAWDAYQARNGNIQPKLLKLLESAFTLTKNKYSQLNKLKITSKSSCPIEIWAKAASIINIHYDNKQILRDELVKLGFEAAKVVSDKQLDSLLKKIMSRSLESTHDLNHALGFAVDVQLTYLNSNNESKYLCLYEPSDDVEFKIFKEFIKNCYSLGATSVGAGMYYMDYPTLLRYISDDGNGGKYKSGLSQHNNKIIVDENYIPLRNAGPKRNGIHVDLIGMNKDSLTKYLSLDFNKNENLLLADYVINFKRSMLSNIGNKKRSNGSLLFEKTINERRSSALKNLKTSDADATVYVGNEEKKAKLVKKFKSLIRRKQGNTHAGALWGSTSGKISADRWLWDVSVRKGGPYSDSYNVKEITTENYKSISAKQFIKDLVDDKKSGFKFDEKQDISDESFKSNPDIKKYFVKESEIK